MAIVAYGETVKETQSYRNRVEFGIAIALEVRLVGSCRLPHQKADPGSGGTFQCLAPSNTRNCASSAYVLLNSKKDDAWLFC